MASCPGGPPPTQIPQWLPIQCCHWARDDSSPLKGKTCAQRRPLTWAQSLLPECPMAVVGRATDGLHCPHLPRPQGLVSSAATALLGGSFCCHGCSAIAPVADEWCAGAYPSPWKLCSCPGRCGANAMQACCSCAHCCVLCASKTGFVAHVRIAAVLLVQQR